MWRMVLFVGVFTLVWGGGHAYLGWTLTRHGEAPRAWRVALYTLLGFNFAVSLAAMIGRRLVSGQALVDGLQMVSYVGMGVAALLFGLVVVRDLLELLVVGGSRLGGVAEVSADVEQPERRQFFGQIANIGLLGAAAAGATVGWRRARRVPDVKEVVVPVKGLHPDLDGFKIAQISDVHVGPTIKRDFWEGVVARVNDIGADMVAITGDMIDGYVDDLRDHTAPMADLKATHGVFYVTGNHEYYWDAHGWCDEFARCGAHVLLNRHRRISHGAASVAVGGVTDYRAERHDESHATDPHAAMRGAEDADFKLLLAHQPRSVHEAARAGFDLQLSGHTHGGQFWPWNLVVGLAHPFTAGLDTYESMQIYVSRGTGYWGPPMRLGAPSEITSLTLKAV